MDHQKLAVLQRLRADCDHGRKQLLQRKQCARNGRYVPKYKRDLNQFDELTQNRLGYEWGKQWIRENPGRFLALACGSRSLDERRQRWRLLGTEGRSARSLICDLSR